MCLNHALIIVKFVLKFSSHRKIFNSSEKKIEYHLLHLSFVTIRNLDANVKVFFKVFYIDSAVSIAKTVEIDEDFVWRIFDSGNEIDKNIPALSELPFVLNN